METGISIEKAKEILESGVGQAQELMPDPSKVNDLLENLEEKLKEIPAVGNTLAEPELKAYAQWREAKKNPGEQISTGETEAPEE